MQNNWKTILLFWRENMRYPGLFLGCIFTWVTGMTLQKLILALIAARALNKLVEVHNHPDVNYLETFGPYLLVFLATALLAQGFINRGLVLLSRLETAVRPRLRLSAFNWVMSQSLAFHANTFSGAIVNQISKFTGAYIQLTDTFVITLLRMMTSVLIAIVVIAFFAPLIALVMAIWTVFFVLLNLKLLKRRMRYSRVATQAETAVTAHLADAMGNVSAIKSFGNEEAETALHSEKSYDHATKKYRSWMVAIKNDFALGLMMTGLQLGTLALSIYGVLHNAIDIGTLLLIQVYISQIIGELWGLSNISRNIEQGITDAEEMTEIFNINPEVIDPKKPEKSRIAEGGITFSSVDFTHEGSDDALFHNFSLTIKPGEKIGLVGHSGSGKTTLTRLLLRFSDIDKGEILIDGQNITSIAQADLRKNIAYVPQEPLLFHRSLLENIAYADAGISKEQVIDASRKAHAHEFIKTLPGGYDTLVGERGVKLSGGQRQRIAIARAIVKDAPILVLDEATSALDSESEKLIQKALKELMEKRTAIVIAHRLSTIQKMDRIVVMDNGTVIEQGTHAELLAQGGAYATLWGHQSGGFIED